MEQGRAVVSLRELSFAFLKIGCLSFGGPLVGLALIHRETVERRRWVSAAWFAETLGLLEAVPGPSATEMSLSVGIATRGRLGGLAAFAAYVTPGFMAMLALSILFFRYRVLPGLSGAVAGLRCAAVAALLLVCLRLLRAVIRDRWDAALAASSCAACLLGAPAAWVFLLAGAGRLAAARPVRLGSLGLYGLAAAPIAAPALPEGLGRLPALFLGMLKAGTLVTGGGYVITSFLSQDFVTKLRWLTPEEFLAGLALAQFKPGPVVLLSVFVGYRAAGLPGAAAAAAAVFLPCVGTLMALGPRLERLRGRPGLSVFLRGMGAASAGAVTAVAAHMFLPAVPGTRAALLFGASLAALRLLEPGWVLAGGALAGALWF